MSLSVICRHCGQSLTVPPWETSSNVSCPFCGGINTVNRPSDNPFADHRPLATGPVNPYQSPLLDETHAALVQDGGLPLANRSTRFAAAIIDLLFVWLGGSVIAAIPMILTMRSRPIDPKHPIDDAQVWMIMGISYAAMFVLMVIQWILTVIYGATVAKLLLGIRLANRTNDDIPDFVRAVLVRSLLNGVISCIPFFGWLYSLIDALCIFGSERRCLHDELAGTRVVVKPQKPVHLPAFPQANKHSSTIGQGGPIPPA